MPKVSVVVPVFNRAECLGAAVDSILAQDFRDFEIIVVDDGSTDSTRTSSALTAIVPLYFSSNQGPGAARNTGVRNATGDWIAFLDSDDVWLPTKLTRQVSLGAIHRSGSLFPRRRESKRQGTDGASFGRP